MFQIDRRNQPSTSQDGRNRSSVAAPVGYTIYEETGWLGKAQEAYENSTSYVDSNYRKEWEDAIRAFHSMHPSDSKYNQPAYAKRSRVYRPKTRSVIRKNEAAAAAAFFSNMDVVSIAAEDQGNKAQLASADIMSAILEYRLRKSVPWFQIVMGGVQDAQTTGVVCSHNYWDHRVRKEEEPEVPKVEEEEVGDDENPVQPQLPKGAFTLSDSERPEVMAEEPPPEKPRPKAYVDKPVIELIPIENLRISPSASWMDPIGTSPYVIHLMPVHYVEVKRKMKAGDWTEYEEAIIKKAASDTADSTRVARNRGNEDPAASSNAALGEYEIIWIQRHIHRNEDDIDIEFYTLGDVAMLTEPRPLSDSVLTGERPYTLGCAVIETHKVLSSGIPRLGLELQSEANEISNQRLDNVKLALNKKWFVKRGKEVDVAGLMRNVPGGAIMMDDPDHDVREITYHDVTQSSYEEQNRINLDMDELLGNFNPAALIMGGRGDAPAKNMAMLSQATGSLAEYLIRTVVETWLLPTLRQLVRLEQKYETDEVVLALAGRKAQLFQKYGVDQVTDSLLNQELTLTVNVGMGATDPMQKLNKFLTATTTYANIVKQNVPGMNTNEVGKEIYSHLGYKDASRFFTVDDPQLIAAQEQIRQAQDIIQKLQKKLDDKQTAQIIGFKKTQETNASKERIAAHQEKNENLRSAATHITALMHAHEERGHDIRMIDMKPKAEKKKSNGK